MKGGTSCFLLTLAGTKQPLEGVKKRWKGTRLPGSGCVGKRFWCKKSREEKMGGGGGLSTGGRGEDIKRGEAEGDVYPRVMFP